MKGRKIKGMVLGVFLLLMVGVCGCTGFEDVDYGTVPEGQVRVWIKNNCNIEHKVSIWVDNEEIGWDYVGSHEKNPYQFDLPNKDRHTHTIRITTLFHDASSSFSLPHVEVVLHQDGGVTFSEY